MSNLQNPFDKGRMLEIWCQAQHQYMVTSEEKLLVTHMIAWTFPDWNCKPSLEMMADRMGVTIKRIRTMLRHLEQAGVIESSEATRAAEGRYRSTKYRLTIGNFTRGMGTGTGGKIEHDRGTGPSAILSTEGARSTRVLRTRGIKNDAQKETPVSALGPTPAEVLPTALRDLFDGVEVIEHVDAWFFKQPPHGVEDRMQALGLDGHRTPAGDIFLSKMRRTGGEESSITSH